MSRHCSGTRNGSRMGLPISSRSRWPIWISQSIILSSAGVDFIQPATDGESVREGLINMVRHLLTAADLDRGSIDKILEYASLAENGNLSLQGKILGFLFLSESTRTSSSLKAAIIKAGGGWLG